MFDAELGPAGVSQWPQPGELWSREMIAKYGSLVLSLESAFERALRHAPPISLAERETEEMAAHFNREIWPNLIDDHIDRISEITRALPLSGIEKKLERIREQAEFCQQSWAEMGSRTSLGEDLSEEDARAFADDPARQRLAFELRALRQHVMDELEEMQFLMLSQQDVSLYEETETPLFGDLVFKRFALANEDIAEAGKCLALGRGTAAVFHLMRVTESGLKALGKELGIPYAPSWESYTRQIDTLLDPANYKRLTPEQLAKRPFYEEVLGDVVAVKRAWRNPTMHIVRSYDVAQAKLIFEATRALMQHLAKELSADPSSVISTGPAAP